MRIEAPGLDKTRNRLAPATLPAVNLRDGHKDLDVVGQRSQSDSELLEGGRVV